MCLTITCFDETITVKGRKRKNLREQSKEKFIGNQTRRQNNMKYIINKKNCIMLSDNVSV